MGVIGDRNRPDRRIAGCVEKIKVPDVNVSRLVQGKVLLSILTVCLVLIGGPAAAVIDVPLKSIAQIKMDDEGVAMRYPAFVFFDPVEEELYVANGGRSRLVVYGPDFFPRMSVASGRGVAAPRGGLVTSDGKVYICQARNVNNPRPRITVLNAAFFPERDIFLDEIPEAADFIPNQLAINSDGIIYLSGAASRGVLVLDNEGNFLRRLQPRDKITYREPVEEAAEEEMQPEEEDASLADIPEEFRPRSNRQEGAGGGGEGLGPVKVNHVTIDSAGKLYLMSNETSKIYVYGPDEAFLFAFGDKGGTPRHLSQPKSLAIDEKRGLIYVADYMRHSILTYDMTGKYLFEFGGRGYGPGWLNYPIGLTINNHGHLIIADLFNHRVQVLNIGYEEITHLLAIGSPQGSTPDDSEAGESTGQDELAPEPPGDIDVQVNPSAGEESTEPDELKSGQPEEIGDRDETPAQLLEKPEPTGDLEGERPDTSE